MIKYAYQIFIIIVLFGVTSCGINSDIMLRTPKSNTSHQTYRIVSPDSLPRKSEADYRLTIDDQIQITISPNGGRQIIDAATQTSDNIVRQNNQLANLAYTIRTDGYANLPVLGDIYLQGLTIKQVEDTLKQLYGQYYIDPFVIVKVTNKRVIIFPGEGGDAKVIPLTNNNTRLMEVIAQAGGLSRRGKSKSIKLMRMMGDERVIVPIDLSKVDHIAYADIIVQGNDYIYVEPHPRVLKQVLQETSPVLSFVTSILLLFNYFFK